MTTPLVDEPFFVAWNRMPSTMRPFASVLSARAEKSSTVAPEAKSRGPIGVRAAWLKDVARKYTTGAGRALIIFIRLDLIRAA
jgi:hypothetical protein